MIGSHCGPPCETYTEARWLVCEDLPADRQPRPLRDVVDPWGLTDRRPDEVQQVSFGTWLMLIALRISLLVLLHGGCCSLEHPRGPLSSSRKWSIWLSGFMKEILNLKCTQICTFLQGPLGRDYAKPTRLLLGRLHQLPGVIYASYQRNWKATQVLGGREGNSWRATAAKEYPVELSRLIATAFLMHSADTESEGEAQDPEGLQQALDHLTHNWDPYHTASSGMMMQGDYNPQVSTG